MYPLRLSLCALCWHSVRRCWVELSFLSVTCPRSRLPGCASVTTTWFRDWKQTSRWRFSSRAHWSSGRHGWTMWWCRRWSPMKEDPASQKPPGSFCSNGLSTGSIPRSLHFLPVLQMCVCTLFTEKRNELRLGGISDSMTVQMWNELLTPNLQQGLKRACMSCINQDLCNIWIGWNGQVDFRYGIYVRNKLYLSRKTCFRPKSVGSPWIKKQTLVF